MAARRNHPRPGTPHAGLATAPEGPQIYGVSAICYHPGEDHMLDWLRRRRLSAEAKRKLLIVAARSEEAVIETHVANVLDLLEMLGGEVDIDRGLELYGEMLPMDEHVAATVANRVIARHDSPGPRSRPAPGRYSNVFRDEGRK